MTANQLVAYNLRQIRREQGLTQEQAAEKLEPLLGKRWSIASFSAAEASARGGRTRVFDANEVLAFALAFGVPVAYFYLPLERQDRISAGGKNVSAEKVLEAVAPEESGEIMADRLRRLGVKHVTLEAELLRGQIGQMQDNMRSLAELLVSHPALEQAGESNPEIENLTSLVEQTSKKIRPTKAKRPRAASSGRTSHKGKEPS